MDGQQLEFHEKKYSVIKKGNVIKLIINEIYTLSIKEAQEIIQKRHEFCGNVPHHVIVLINPELGVKGFPRTVAEEINSDRSEQLKLSTSIILKNPLHQFMGTILMSLKRCKVPLKVFRSEEDALEWIMRLDLKS